MWGPVNTCSVIRQGFSVTVYVALTILDTQGSYDHMKVECDFGPGVKKEREKTDNPSAKRKRKKTENPNEG